MRLEGTEGAYGANLGSSSFLLGFFSLMAQVILIRELFVVFYGSELTIGLVFAAWLFWVGAGSLAGGKAVAAMPPGTGRDRLLLIVQGAAALLLPVTVLLIRSIRLWVPVDPGAFLALRLTAPLSVALLSGIGLAYGLWFTLAAALPSESRTGPGRTYAWEAVGGLLAGGIFSFVLSERFEGLQLGLLLALLLPAATLLSWTPATKSLRPRLLTAAAVIALGAPLLASAQGPFGDWIRRSRSWGWPGLEMLDSRDSRYGNLALLRVGNQKTLYENGVPSFSFPDPLSSIETIHLPLLAAPSLEKVLLIGGGLGGGLGEILRYPVRKVDYLELDPEALNIIHGHLPPALAAPLGDPRVRILHIDGRAWLRRRSEQYDVILLNLPAPSTALINRFFTREFFLLSKESLREAGLLSFSLPASPNYFGEALQLRNGSVFQTLRGVFPSVAALPAGRNVFLATGSPSLPDLSPEYLQEKIEKSGVAGAYVRSEVLASFLDPDRTLFLRKQLSVLTAQNSDFSPAAYFYHTFFWSGMSDPGLAPWLRRLLGPARFMPFLLPAAALLAGLWFTGPSRPGVGFSLGLTAVTTGWGAMSCQYLILFAFQASRGHLYRQIGVLSGFFMAGLAGGGFCTLMLLRRSRNPFLLLHFSEMALLVWPPFLGVFLHYLAGETAGDWGFHADGAYILLSGLSGFIVGLQFPLFSLLDRRAGTEPGSIGGRYYFLDLVGSGLGVLLATLWLLPLLGVWLTLGLCAALKLASWAVLMTGRKRFLPSTV